MLLICLRIKSPLAAEYFQVRIKQTEKQVRELEKEWRKECFYTRIKMLFLCVLLFATSSLADNFEDAGNSNMGRRGKYLLFKSDRRVDKTRVTDSVLVCGNFSVQNILSQR